MKLINQIKAELSNDKIMLPIELTKNTQENIEYLLNEFDCETTDELINILLCYAATAEYTEKIKKDLYE